MAVRKLLSDGADRVIGTHLFPLRLFGDPLTPDNVDEAVRIIKTISLPFEDGKQHVLLVTRMSGLFIEPPVELRPSGNPSATQDPGVWQELVKFYDQFASGLNLLICELALRGVISEPASPLHISGARRWGQYAAVTTGGGGREAYHQRTIDPLAALLGMPESFLSLNSTDPSVLDEVANLELAGKLAAITPQLPMFVAAAHSLFSRRLLAEALLDAWIVVEQILNHVWATQYVAKALDGPHRKRLNDSRSFTANVIAEVLFADGHLDEGSYQQIQKARKNRNDLAHGAEVTTDRAKDAMLAMRSALSLAIGTEGAWPLVNEGITW